MSETIMLSDAITGERVVIIWRNIDYLVKMEEETVIYMGIHCLRVSQPINHVELAIERAAKRNE